MSLHFLQHFLGNVRLRVERRQSTPVTLSRTFRTASPDCFPMDFGRFGQMGAAPQFQIPPFIAPPMMYNNGFGFPAPQFGVPGPMPAPMPPFGPGPSAPGHGNSS